MLACGAADENDVACAHGDKTVLEAELSGERRMVSEGTMAFEWHVIQKNPYRGEMLGLLLARVGREPPVETCSALPLWHGGGRACKVMMTPDGDGDDDVCDDVCDDRADAADPHE